MIFIDCYNDSACSTSSGFGLNEFHIPHLYVTWQSDNYGREQVFMLIIPGESARVHLYQEHTQAEDVHFCV